MSFFLLREAIEGYRLKDFRADALAGLTTAVMLVPQGMAYAMLAGLPAIMGLYAALVPPVAYALVGTSRELSVGPVALDSLLVAAGVGALHQAGSEAYVAAAVLLALMVGVIQLLMGLFKMGFLVNFVSHPVMSGFTSAAALMIGLSQAKHLLGVEVKGDQNFFVMLLRIVEVIGETKMEPLLIGGLGTAGLLGLKIWAPKVPGALIAVVLATLAVAVLGWGERTPIVGEVPAGLPPFSMPSVETSLVVALLPTAATIALVAFMESISVSQTIARKNRVRVIPDRELLALGAANLMGSFFRGYPVAGGFSRTAVNASAGARTQIAGLVSASLIFLSLLFLTPLFYFMPNAILAAIVMTAVYGLIDFAAVKHLKQVKKDDLVLLAVTFFATLGLGIVSGMAMGVGASLLWFLFRTTRPHIAILGRVPGTNLFQNVSRRRGLTTYFGVLAVRMDARFYFGNIAFLRSTLARFESEMEESLLAVILDASAINGLDSSADHALREMCAEYRTRGVQFFLTGVKGPVLDVLKDSGLEEEMGIHCRCRTVHDAVVLLDAKARPKAHPTLAPHSESGRKASGASARL